MKTPRPTLLLAFVLLPALAFAGSSAEPITTDWHAPETLQRLHVQSFRASSIVDPASGNYNPSKAVDGNRQTKWAAAEAPSPTAPQWLELRFTNERRISSVAVFGERIGNDGIVDAQIQVVRSTGSWQTVAAISNATSSAWLAHFSETNASAVRLLITRSSGPSPHTDVYEVEVYGRPLSSQELYTQAQMQLDDARKRRATVPPDTASNTAWFGNLQQSSDASNARFQKAAVRFDSWKNLSAQEQQGLTEELETIVGELQSWHTSAKRRNDLFQSRLSALQSARAAFKNASETTQEEKTQNGIELLNRHVLLQCNQDGTSWSAFWNGAADAAISGAGFEIIIDGRRLSPTNAHIELTDFHDSSGTGKQLSQRWGDGIQIERWLRVYDNGAMTISGQVKNSSAHAVTLDSVHPLIVSPGKTTGWLNGNVTHLPAAVSLAGASEWQCAPGRTLDWSRNDVQNYSSTQVLNLTDAEGQHGLTVAFLSAFSARPELQVQFRCGEGGTSLVARQNFLGRRLNAGDTLALDPLYLKANDDAFAGLEDYAETAEHFAQAPVRKGATALWCSWYAHRMAVDEDLVLANAAVAAKYFKPLGFEIMQLDHGWQVGDVTGDWVPDPKSFPHGFKWLSQELQSRYGLKLGVWIAPTDVAESSETFKQHPDWMLKDGQGKPLVNWRWYWKPNPNCYELDASNPEAARWMENVFSRLSADGVSYYKIDFIASSGGEQFIQKDPTVTRGWSVLREAMESVRRGAGTNAWIRYCQPPPLLSAGLADGAYGGDDTLDAGLNGDIHVLRSNARSLAASYWLNDRLYHREVCDMSVRMQADVEEVRMRLAMMTLANCSISFSDELRYLPSSRLRMMQACLPPGNPAMKPLDLFERTLPSIWQVHCKNDSEEWDVVGLFNFENTPETRTVDFARLNLPADAEVAAFEFWEQTFGIHRTNLTVTLPPQSSRIFALHRLSKHPQIVGTDLHLLQGQHELKQITWDETNHRLSGECERAAGIEGKLFVYVPSNYAPHFEFPLNAKSAQLTHVSGNLWAYEIAFRNERENWKIPFDQK